MNEQCGFPPALAFEQKVIGPFTAREALLIMLFTLPALPALRASPWVALFATGSCAALGAIHVLAARRGRNPLRLLWFVLTVRHTALRIAGSEAGSRRAYAARFNDVNFACALSGTRESFVSSLTSVCATQKYVRLVAVPDRPQVLSFPAGTEARLAGGRSFYLCLPDRSQLQLPDGTAVSPAADGYPGLISAFTEGGTS